MKSVLQLLTGIVQMALRHRFGSRKVETFEELVEFVSTRSAYVAQTSLYGYLKTRMGTRFRDFFENDEFSRVIHESATKLFASCVGDLTVFGVGLVVDREDIDDEQARRLARAVFGAAVEAGVPAEEQRLIPAQAKSDFESRIEKMLWRGASNGERAFAASLDDLIRFAPVVDEFKALDSEIVRNSIRFRWRDVREQLRSRLDTPAIAALGPDQSPSGATDLAAPASPGG
ncbi:MAG: hypothetical protein OEN23_13065 [Paracoccaceae bacterium]|nr:hypothetical protein [Paracoccaceae bacterium]